MSTQTRKTLQEHVFDVLNNIYATAALTVIVFAVTTLYSRFGNAWSRPVVNGMLVAALAFSLLLSYRAILSLPNAGPKTTAENVDNKVLSWLLRFNYSVRRDNDTNAFFSFLITTEAGRRIVIKRSLGPVSDYLTISGLLTLSEADKELVALMTDREAQEAQNAFQIELFRSVVGFNATDILNKGILIFKHVPIAPDLREKDLLNAIFEVEAMLGLVVLVNSESKARIELAHGIVPTGSQKKSVTPENG